MNRITLIAALVSTPMVLLAPITGAKDSAELRLARAEAEIALVSEAVSLETDYGTSIDVTIE